MERSPKKLPKRRPSPAASSYFAIPFKDPSLRWVKFRLPCQQPRRPTRPAPRSRAPPRHLEPSKKPAVASPAPRPPAPPRRLEPSKKPAAAAAPPPVPVVIALPAANCPAPKGPVKRWNNRNKGKSNKGKSTVEKNESPDEVAAPPVQTGGTTRSSDRFFLRSQVEKPEQSIKFSLALTEEEIMKDLFIMTGKMPSARPKRHPKNVQKHLKGLFPGSELPERVTPEMYEVIEKHGRDAR